MATTLLASGTSEASTSDIVVAAGTPATVYVQPAALPMDANTKATIEFKAGSLYMDVGVLTVAQPVLALTAAGTYRITRHACVQAIALMQV